MAGSSTDKQGFRNLTRSKFEDATQACVAKAHAMLLGQPSINLILAGEPIRLGAAFAIRLGANEDGVASMARGSCAEAQDLVRSPPSGLFWDSRAARAPTPNDGTPALELQMDRADAMRLLKTLVAAGMDTRAPRTNAWIQKKALEIGLEGSQFVSAIAYAGNEGWLADAPRKGWTSLTDAGETIARR